MEQNNVDVKHNNSTVVSVISYLSIMGWLIAIFFLNNPKQVEVDFHLRQSLGIHMSMMACSVLFAVPILGWIAGVFGMFIVGLMWLIGILAAIQSKEKVVPFLGDQFQEWFQGL